MHHIHNGQVPQDALPVTFGLLLNLVGVMGGDATKDQVWGYLGNYLPGATAADYPELDKLIGYALAYARDFVAPTLVRRAPEGVEVAALEAARRRSRRAARGRDAPRTSRTSSTRSARRGGFAELRDWFKALYETLLGSSQGPRMGSFIALYGVANTRKLIAEALANNRSVTPDLFRADGAANIGREAAGGCEQGRHDGERWRNERPSSALPDDEAAGGIVLIAAAALAMIAANSPLADAYFHLLHAETGPVLAPKLGPMTVHLWINDALMAVFFLLVGLEIKRELVDGELAAPDERRLPVIAAAAGMAVPALVYLAIAGGAADVRSGWAIPAATDIAFAIGVLALARAARAGLAQAVPDDRRDRRRYGRGGDHRAVLHARPGARGAGRRGGGRGGDGRRSTGSG